MELNLVKPLGITAFFDGCCEPRNPGGHIGYGAVIFKDGQNLWEYSGYEKPSPETSNNVAEYMAFSVILVHLLGLGLNNYPIVMLGDSKLVINQMFGSWQIKQGNYVPFALQSRDFLRHFKNIVGAWISRDCNVLADKLSKAELRKRGVEFRIQPEKQ